MPYAIETRQLTKIYRSPWGRRRLRAVDQLDLRVQQGTVFGFLGPNGAGKTTTIMMLLGNTRPTSGSARLLGLPNGSLEARRRLGFLPEKFQFHEFLTAEEFLELHGRLAGLSPALRRQRADAALAMVGLEDRRKQRLRQFSKGMQQRIGLAQALLADPELVILDEPTSALDPLGRRQVRDIILRLKQLGRTVFLNSHLLSEIELTCDEVAIINQGRLVRQGSIEDLTAPTARVTVQLDRLSPALLEVMGRFGAVQQRNHTEVEVQMWPGAETPDLVAALYQVGARLQAVIPHRESLEDYFVRVVRGDEEVANGAKQ
ncbi:MAG: ABC transporter ATP-binding protein [Armatimonadetes bacterium]|nr:ABC transporter ATP-binding protein [Armatimonadota bacterium]